eukprot:c5453_g1_i2.p1 GENE.c5453_g1_i2~~c5453_g1_i2.p1  ORF type:complete len:311 (-),score=70.55 c5453_g1_i2:108-1040(-)
MTSHTTRNSTNTAPTRAKTQHMIAGTIGGAASTFVTFPLDLVKVRYQVHTASATPYTSLLSALMTIARKEGPRALYQGMLPGLVGSSVSWGGYFFFYERAKARYSKDSQTELHSGHHLMASVEAGAILVFLTNPIWLVKTRLQLQQRGVGDANSHYRGMTHALRQIVKEEGFRGLYRGVVPALLLTSHGAVQFMVYERLKKFQFSADVRGDKPILVRGLEILSIGGISKLVAACVTYPSQVMKTRLQKRSANYQGKTEFGRLVSCIRETYVNEGIRGFFKGCWANALRVAPSAAITFWCYEEVLLLLQRF